MHDMVCVAIVDTGEDLLYKHGSVLLRKFTSCDNLVEQLSTLAYIGYDVVPLLIFEELVHLQNIWMVQVLEVVNLVEEHFLLIVVHM